MMRPLQIVFGCALLGLPAGAVWLLAAKPAHWMMTPTGLVMPEELAAGHFNVFATFVIIGVVVGILVGVVCGYLLQPLTWRSVLVSVPAALAAAGVAWLVGTTLGPDAMPSPHGLAEGEMVPAAFRVDSVTAFLVWPMASVFVLAGWSWATYNPETESNV